MLTLNDGRSELWQWDTGRTLTVDADCSQVHFSNKVFGRSIDVDVVDGAAIIPDVLLAHSAESGFSILPVQLPAVCIGQQLPHPCALALP